MATIGLYGNSSESVGLYGNTTNYGGTYFQWFIFDESATAPATPTGGSWNFTTNTGTAPTGWTNAPPASPTNLVWVSIAIVDSRSSAALVWSTPGLLTGSGLPVLTGSGVPSNGTGLNGQLYIDTSTSPQGLYNKQSGAWVQITGSALYVDLTSTQTIAGTKTFSSQIQGSVSGNAANVTGTVAVANGGTGSTNASDARTSLSVPSTTGSGASGTWGINVTGNAATSTSTVSVQGVVGSVVGTTQTQTLTNKTIDAANNTLTNIPNASLVYDSVNVNGVDLTLGAVQTLGPDWILPSYAGNAGKVLTVNPSSSDVQWNVVTGTGTVTSVDVSGGSTGLTATGGPITAAGTITLGGTLAVANGGTGATNLTAAFNALAPSQTGNAGKYLTTNGTNASWGNITGTISYQGSWDASTNSPALTSSVGVNGYYYVVSVAGSTNLNGITDWQIGDWAIFNGSVWQKIDQSNTVTSVAGRTGAVVLTTADIGGLGTIATQNANSVAITGGSITGITDLAIADGGTGSSTASGARTNLGLGTIATQDANSVAITGGAIDGTTIGATTSSSAKFTTGLVGSSASFTDFPNAKLVGSQADTGSGHIYNIGVAGEGVATDVVGAGQWGVGVYGTGATAGATRGIGVVGDGHVSNTADTAAAIGVRGYATQTHSGGQNIGFYAQATGGASNYALFMASGNIYSAVTQTWSIPDNSSNALSFDASGKAGILAITTTDGAETVSMSGKLSVAADASFTSTGAVQLSSGTTGQRPTGAAGKLRFNTTTAEFEGYNGASWASVGGSAISNDTSTASNLFPLFASATTGTASSVFTSNAQYLFKPSTGELSVKAPRASNGIVVNSATISSDYTIATGDNGMSAGPVAVNSGVTVTVSSGSVWTVV